MDENVIYEVLSVVGEIPAGRVATYGQIARLTGREKNSRLVGKILSQSQGNTAQFSTKANKPAPSGWLKEEQYYWHTCVQSESGQQAGPVS